MEKGLDNYLVEKYPKIFVNRHADMKTTAMCWGFEHGDGWFWLLDQLCNSIQSYIDNNSKETIIKNKFLRYLSKNLIRLSYKGSYKRQYSKYKLIIKVLKIINILLYRIGNHIDTKSKKIEVEKIAQVVATQVKEKYGYLNFYYTGGDEYISGIVSLAEKMSISICEECGTTKNIGRTTGWFRYICKDCYEEYKNDRINKGMYFNNWEEIKLPLLLERKLKLNNLNHI